MYNDYIYDIETYPNVYTIAIGEVSSRNCKVFEISFRKDQRLEMIEYFRHIVRNKGRMVGFNNVGFDYPVVHFIIKNQNATVEDIYNYAMEVIKSEDKWAYNVKDNDVLIPQVDLFKIHHFDNKARMTSLKMLEFNMRSENIEDLPFPVGTHLTSEEIDVLIKYNRHDMVQTFQFYNESKTHIEFREVLSKQLGKDVMNFNDTKLGKDLFITELEKNNKGCCYKYGKKQQTKRKSIKLKDCIFGYTKFERPEFQAVLNWLNKQTITETKGVFNDLLESDLGDVAKYAVMRVKRQKLKGKPNEDELTKYKKELPLHWIEEKELKSPKGAISYYLCWNIADNLNVVLDGFRYDFGTGGIHGSVESSIICSDDEYLVRDEDVASYYPNLAIKNRIYPKHLGEEFCNIYEGLYNQRKVYKKQGRDAEQQMLKLALNGTYGASNDQYSPLYDPMFTMSITINGQLSLCMLAEQLLKIDNLTMIQINTDGLTFKIPHESNARATDICTWWQTVTKLELETAEYAKMIIRDVNNYIAVKHNGSMKNKGAYAWKTKHHDPEHPDLGWHQNHSAPVISMAAERFLVAGDDIETTIMNHKDHFDFMLRTKVPRSSRLVMVDDFECDNVLQNICRYYISDNGGYLVKIMPPMTPTKLMSVFLDDDGVKLNAGTKGDINKYTKKGYRFLGEFEIEQPERRMGISVGWKCVPCNDINNFKGNINYDYYIKEAIKLAGFGMVNDDEESE